MDKILKFDHKSCKKVELSGGKGSSLARLTQNNIPVPPGFVVTAEVYKKMVNSSRIDELLKTINIENIQSVNKASQKLQKYVGSLRISQKIKREILNTYDQQNLSLVAVRSSATSEDTKEASWAGELKTFLNTSKEKLLERIVECWSSLFSPQALLYRFEKGFESREIAVAVVVQEMVQSEVSGVCFTVHPVTNRKDHMFMEAVWGLGEAIVSGQVTPDSYLYDKQYDVVLRVETKKQAKKLSLPENLKGVLWEDVEKNQQTEQKINYKQIMELANICKEVESCCGAPQDIEWSYWGNTFYILQSRPITTL